MAEKINTSAPKVGYVCPVTEPDTLEAILKPSPDINENNLTTVTGERSATNMINGILDNNPSADIIVFLHQDVYLPKGWQKKLQHSVKTLEARNIKWGAIGVAGATKNGNLSCSLWCSSLKTEISQRTDAIEEVESLDEVLIAINVQEYVKFDERHPGFHLFGTSIVQTFLEHNLKSYSIDAPIIHHDKKKYTLGKSYFEAYKYLKQKYAMNLPINTTILPISRFGLKLRIRELKFKIKRTPPASYNLINPVKLSKKLGYE